MSELLTTPFRNLIAAQGAKFTEFAGYEMPVSFTGILDEARAVRAPGKAGLFDVSHMGQIEITGSDVARAFERVVPSAIEEFAVKKFKYSVLLNEKGGVIDDVTLVKNENGSIYLVVNASRKAVAFAYLREHLPKNIDLRLCDDLVLLALQGEGAQIALSRYLPAVATMKYADSAILMFEGVSCRVTRCGYTGEDGFELSFKASSAEKIYKLLSDMPNVQPIGLAARDTLRLEAGLCLYGHELTEEITPIEADLAWVVSKKRAAEQSFIGANVIAKQLSEGMKKIRIGLLPQGRPVREGTELRDQTTGEKIGFVTSGGFSPVLNAPVSCGYVSPAYKNNGESIVAEVRGASVEMKITSLPFVPHRYKK